MSNRMFFLTIFTLFAVVFFFWWKTPVDKRDGFFSMPTGPAVPIASLSQSPPQETLSGQSNNIPISQQNIPIADPNSPSVFAKYFTLKRGTAGKKIQPREEYLILEYSRRAPGPVSISGWQLQNNPARNGHYYRLPLGVKILYPQSNQRLLQDIILNPGDKVIIISGHYPSLRPVAVEQAFQLNSCLGYLDYKLTPSIAKKCPKPTAVAGYEYLDDDCYAFVRKLKTCHTPKVIEQGEKAGYIDKVKGLSSQCRDFLVENYSYEGCLNNFINDSNFLLAEWRLYLNQQWTLWASNREIITLFDLQGREVVKLAY